MSTQPSSYRGSRLMDNITNLIIIVVIVFTVYMAWPTLIWPLLQARLNGTLPVLLTPEPAIVATQRPVSVPRPVQQQQEIQQPIAPPAVIPTAYTWQDAEATSTAQYQQVIQEVEAAIPAPNGQKEVVLEPAVQGINADWCTGSHADNPECQPGNGQKVGR